MKLKEALILFFRQDFVCHRGIRARGTKICHRCVIVILLFLLMFPMKSQTQNTESGQWHFLAEPYDVFLYEW